MQHTRGICMWFSPIFNNYALNRSYICMLGLIRMKYHQTPETLIDFLFFPHSLETSDDSGVISIPLVLPLLDNTLMRGRDGKCWKRGS